MTQIILATGAGTLQNWIVPNDWNPSANTVGTLAGGASGYPASVPGGGGGAFSQVTNLNLTPGASIPYEIGIGGFAPGSSGQNGGDTWFGNATYGSAYVGAKGGGYSGGGGNATGGIGTLKYSGGDGASPGRAGGGAAGPNGAGIAGAGETGGQGDNGYGGLGGVQNTDGSPGTEWGSYGSGGGGGGAVPAGIGIAGDGGQYGAGGGSANAIGNVGSGTQGLIIITYTPTAGGSGRRRTQASVC